MAKLTSICWIVSIQPWEVMKPFRTHIALSQTHYVLDNKRVSPRIRMNQISLLCYYLPFPSHIKNPLLLPILWGHSCPACRTRPCVCEMLNLGRAYLVRWSATDIRSHCSLSLLMEPRACQAYMMTCSIRQPLSFEICSWNL
jgi:hypothetical protein